MMAKIKKIVTSEVEGRNLSDFYGDNSYSFDTDGTINYYGPNKMGPVIEPGIIYGSNADSGDGYGYNTIKLIPHAPDGYINDDRYLIVDPTQPNHIHIRAGGIQDASNADLILGAEETHVMISDSYDTVILKSASGQYLQYSSPEKQIATIGDISSAVPTKVRYTPNFTATGLVFTGTNETHPAYNSYYVKHGDLVTFNISVDMTTVTDFGTGQFALELPFAPIPSAANHFSAWAWVDPTQPADALNGHIQLVADHLQNSQILDLHWLKETTAEPKPLIESILSQGNPITFTTASKLYVNGTYICQ